MCFSECRVVKAALKRGGEEELLQLMARFRQCFVDALQPKHLSSSWQINHRYAGWHTTSGNNL